MPSKGARYCSCGRIVQPGSQCVCTAARKALADQARPSRQERGYDGDWFKARAKHLARFPYCVECGDKATLVDHIVSIRKAPERRLDPTNHQSMCATCHGRKTVRFDGGFGRS